MKASGLGFEEVAPDDVLLMSWDGECSRVPVAGTPSAPSEVVRARSDVGSVIHTHAPAAVAMGALGVPLRPISHEANLLVPPDSARFTATGDLVLTADLGRAVAAVLGDRNACLLATTASRRRAGRADGDRHRLPAGPRLPHAADRHGGGWATWSRPQESLAKREH